MGVRSMSTYKTQQGDTWDLIALRVYGDEHFMDTLIKANIEHRKTVIFSHSVTLTVPEIDTTDKVYEANLPPWKREGGTDA